MTKDIDRELKHVTIYTDGGCIGNPGPGGYGIVLLYGQKRREISGGFRRTTNNRMEIRAAIVGLQALRYRCDVTIYTDSYYLAKSIMEGWAERWRARGWVNSNKPVPNADLWACLLDLCTQHEVRFEWVKGHAGNPENECCDRLSMQAAKGDDLPIDEGYENTPDPSEDLFDRSNGNQEKADSPQNSRVKITAEGQPCRKCGTPVIKKIPRTKHKPGQAYYYEYYLLCPKCGDMYMVEAAKRTVHNQAQ